MAVLAENAVEQPEPLMTVVTGPVETGQYPRAYPRVSSDEDPASVVEGLEHRSRAVVAAELRRLARRSPGLDETRLRIVEAALDELVERLVLSPVRCHPRAAPHVRVLFDLDATTTWTEPHVRAT